MTQHRLDIERTGQGWQVRGLPREPVCLYAELADALDVAKQACGAEPAVIRFFADGQYIVTAHQEQGWPLALCRPPGAKGSSRASGGNALSRLFRG